MVKPLALCIIGHPIGHSLSPLMHEVAAKANGYKEDEFRYEKYDVPPLELAAFMSKFREWGMNGMNITVPHKVAVMEFLDAISPDAKVIGAVNTVARQNDGRLTGHNTDGYGFLTSITENAGTDPAGKKVLIYGAGGAARAAVPALIEAGAANVVIANRTLAKAEELIARLDRAWPLATIAFEDAESVIKSVKGADIIVNTTSVGMTGADETRELPGAGDIREGQLVVDIVYKPLETPLLKKARAAGAKTLDGLWMLIHQGARAFEIWTGMKFPVPEIRRALEAELDE